MIIGERNLHNQKHSPACVRACALMDRPQLVDNSIWFQSVAKGATPIFMI